MGDAIAQFLLELIPWRITVPCALSLLLVLGVVCALDLAMPSTVIWVGAGTVGLLLGVFWQYCNHASTRP